MSDPQIQDLELRLAQLLPDAARVRLTGTASLGAQRRTLFIDLIGADATRAAVAQIASGPLALADVEIEARLIRDAAAAGVRVPEVLAWDAKQGIVIAARVEGESIPRRILRRVEADPTLGNKLAADCGRALAALHRMPAEGFASLPDFAAPTSYVEMLAETLDALSTPHPTFRLGLNWLTRNPPSACGASQLVHGDFRNGNLLVSEEGLAAVLDWELAHRGDPMEDLAWLCLRTWRFGNDTREVGGFASLECLRSTYLEHGGQWRDDAFRWWTIARTVWWGLGLARQAEAFIDSEATSIVLAASGRRVVELEYDLLQLISDASSRQDNAQGIL